MMELFELLNWTTLLPWNTHRSPVAMVVLQMPSSPRRIASPRLPCRASVISIIACVFARWFIIVILFSAQMRGVVERGACLLGLQRVRRLLPATTVSALWRPLPYRVETRSHHGKCPLCKWPSFLQKKPINFPDLTLISADFSFIKLLIKFITSSFIFFSIFSLSVTDIKFFID